MSDLLTVIAKENGTAEKLKKKQVREFEGLTPFFSFHCLLHQEAQCAKSIKVAHVMGTVVKTEYYLCKCS
jgi:hypothetical protein